MPYPTATELHRPKNRCIALKSRLFQLPLLDVLSIPTRSTPTNLPPITMAAPVETYCEEMNKTVVRTIPEPPERRRMLKSTQNITTSTFTYHIPNVFHSDDRAPFVLDEVQRDSLSSEDFNIWSRRVRNT